MSLLRTRSPPPRWPEFPGAEVPSLFHIEIPRQWWQRCNFSAELLPALQHNLRPISVLFHVAMNLDDFSRKLPDVANILQVMRENHDREAAQPVVIAEIKVVLAVLAHRNAHHLAGYALRLANVFLRLIERNAGRGECRSRQKPRSRNPRQYSHAEILGFLFMDENGKIEKNEESFPEWNVEVRASRPNSGDARVPYPNSSGRP